MDFEKNEEYFRIVFQAIDCHLRVSTVAQKYKKKCPLCEVHDLIEVYENTLFHFVKGEIKGIKPRARASLPVTELFCSR